MKYVPVLLKGIWKRQQLDNLLIYLLTFFFLLRFCSIYFCVKFKIDEKVSLSKNDYSPQINKPMELKKNNFQWDIWQIWKCNYISKKTTNIFTHENVQDYQMSMKKDLSHEVTQKTLKLKIQS